MDGHQRLREPLGLVANLLRTGHSRLHPHICFVAGTQRTLGKISSIVIFGKICIFFFCLLHSLRFAQFRDELAVLSATAQE